ncbi:signal peptide-containing protein [Theileria equi strain WA]|uniref:Signal peptide-containing protein n=1 Tax=Theileria equi strain WA TaxID=1537102 RepID=L0B1G8_THEEQ|nr:signal peptide-containing protein [Theileria equi strain WA]AFZ80954.1 signal peptide-containing protein [Theileria equi strain WA]|eukprot:XP_004830620.1 signal peptide-containing protein [Theileria equi strain WA]
MRLFSLLSIAFLFGFCYCASPNDCKDQGVAETKIVKLDVNDIDEGLLTVTRSSIDGVPLKTVTPKEGHQLTEVYDLNVRIWKGADKEHCLQVLVYYNEESPASVIVNFVKADGKKPWRYHNKQGDKWNVVKKEDHEKLLVELKKKVPQFPPPKDPKTLDLASLADSRYKTVDLSIDGVPARVYLVGPKEDINKVNYSGEEVWKASRFSEGKHGYKDTPEEICTYCITFLKEKDTKMILVNIYDVTVYREIFKQRGDKWERSTSYAGEIAALKTHKDPPKKFTLDISSLEEGDEKFKLVKEENNGATTFFFATKQGYSIENIMDGETKVCAINKDFTCYLCELHSKGDSKLIRVHAEKSFKISLSWYEKSGDKWNGITQIDFFKKLNEISKFGKTLSNTVKQEFPKPAPRSERVNKVDSTLFNVEEGQENGFKVLKLKAKEGTKADKLTFGGLTLWQSQNAGDACLTATFYLGEKEPIAASYRFKRDGKLIEGYRQFSNGNWFQVNGAAFRTFIGKDVPVTTPKELSTKSAGHGDALDTANPDETNIDIDEYTESGVSFKGYYPKDAFHISSVVDGNKELWKPAEGTNEKCLLVESYAKDGVELLYLETSGGTKSKYFEKADGVWNEVGRELFNEQLMTMIGESGKNASLNIAHPNRLLYKSFDYTFATNSVKLVVPKKGISISTLMNGTEEVYTLPSVREKFDHAKVYLNKDKKPELVLLVTTLSGTPKETYLELKDGKWVSCDDHDAKIKSLKDTTEWKSDFEIDLSASKDTDNCSIFEVELLGITTRHFYPKAGYMAIQVKDGNKGLWTAPTNNDYCFSCIIHNKGDKELLEMIVVERCSRHLTFFEKASTEWNEIENTTFNDKLKEMRNGTANPAPTQPSQGSTNPTSKP